MELILTSAVAASLVIAILSSFLGVWIVKTKPSWYSESRIKFMIAMSTGLLLAIAFLEFIPHSLESKTGPAFILLGVLCALFFDISVVPRVLSDFFKTGESQSTCYHGSHHQYNHSHILSQKSSCSAVGCFLVCSFLDGFEIASAFAINTEAGGLVSLGLLFHLLPDGILVASLALAGGLSKRIAQYLSLSVGASLLMGTLLGVFFSQIEVFKTTTIALATGVLIYVCFLHLLPLVLKKTRDTWVLILSALVFTLFISMVTF